MKRRVRYHGSFRQDLRAQLSRLANEREARWIEGLREGLEEAARLLASHPGVGALEGVRGPTELRRLILRRVPYLVWYAHEPTSPRGDVWVLRLFHAKQRRPRPTWPSSPGAPAGTKRARARR